MSRLCPLSTVYFFSSRTTPSIATPNKSTPFKNLESCSTLLELKQHHAQTIKFDRLSSDNDAMGLVVKFCSLSHSGDLELCSQDNGTVVVDQRGDDDRLKEFSQLLAQTQGRRRHMVSPRPRQIHRVAPQLRLQNEHVYNPVMVSLGPYHHGKPELSRAEEFKFICLDWYCRKDEERKMILYDKILERIDEIRSCYADVVIVEKFDDKALALMMLLDACFIINFMDNGVSSRTKNNIADWLDCLGLAASIPFTTRDIMVLENQLPFFVIKLLMSSLYEAEEAETILRKFLSWMTSVDIQNEPYVVPAEHEEPPIHLLEASWRVFVMGKHYNAFPIQQVPDQLLDQNDTSYTYRSVMDLKAKGVKFGPSSSQSLKDIKFKSRRLQLPVRRVWHQSQVLISNMIAYEVSPNTKTEPVMLSYTNLMKSLIQSPEDVKELKEKGILINRFANDEQVVQMYKEINTFGHAKLDSFRDVKMGIEEHCRSKAKTWIADLIHTRFKTPWSIIAFVAATLLLCLTFLQTFITIRPVN